MRSRDVATWLSIVSLALLQAGMSGCIFDMREAQLPGDETTSWVVPDFPTKVFVNMTSGLESLTGTNYEKSLGTDFAFIPLPGDAANFPGTFDNWGRDTEIEVMSKMIGDAQSVSVDFSNLTSIITETSYAQYEGNYVLEIVNKAAPDTSRYKAKARFDLREGSKGWELEKWEEIVADPQYPSWGFLRGILKGG